MQFLTAKTVLYIRSFVHFTAAFFLLKSPATIINANVNALLGQAMNLPMIQVAESNPLFGLLAVFVALQGLMDLIPALADNVAFFELVVPIRLTIYFMLGLFCLFSDFGLVANNVVFTYSFLEIWLNFVVYNNLRDEKYYRAKEYLEKHGEELRDAANAQVLPIPKDE